MAERRIQQPDQEGKWGRRFGEVAHFGIAAVPILLYRLQGALGLSPEETWFISFVLSYKWDERDPYPSLREIARLSGVPKSTLVGYKDSLVRKGLLRVRRRRDPRGGNLSHAYDFTPLFRRMEKIIETLQSGNESSLPNGGGRLVDPRGSTGRPEEDEFQEEKKKKKKRTPSLSPPTRGRAVCPVCQREVQAEAMIDGICAACWTLKGILGGEGG